jgi:serine/threonine protein phosphatase PrpC
MLPCLNEAQWEAALPRAISAGYQLRNRQFVSAGRVGGCTATTVFLNGWSVTCGNVGDSSCYVDSGNEVQRLSADHRLDFNDKEVCVRPTTRPVQVNSRTHVPLGIECLISLCTKPVSIFRVPIQTVR